MSEDLTMSHSKIRLTFSTTAGDLEDDFPANQPLHATKTSVMARLHLDPSSASDFIVVYQGQPLDEQKTLSELGVPSDAVLFIERRDVIKI
jgi:hypothetical protein